MLRFFSLVLIHMKAFNNLTPNVLNSVCCFWFTNGPTTLWLDVRL